MSDPPPTSSTTLSRAWAETKTGLLRHNKSKSTWQVSNLLDLPYIHRKLKQTLAPCWQQVAMGCFGFLWTCWRLNKLETRQVAKLVQSHQNISNILKEQLKVGAILKAWLPTKLPSLSQKQRLRSNILNKFFFTDWERIMCS